MNNRKIKIDNNFLLVFSLVVIIVIFCFLFSIPIWIDKIVINDYENDIVKNKKEKLIVENKNTTLKEQQIFHNDYFWGDLSAPVQLVVYNDFACPFCLEFSKTIKKIKENFGDKVVIILRHFPLRSHTEAVKAALASECAGEQGKFWEMYDKLFNDNENEKFNDNQFRIDANELELDIEKFSKCLEVEMYKNKIESQIQEGKDKNVTGTPSSFLNSKPLPGAYPFEDFEDQNGKTQKGLKKIIEEELNKRL